MRRRRQAPVRRKLVLESDYFKLATDWSTDGEFVLYYEAHPETSADLWLLPLSGDRQPTPFLQAPFLEADGVFSPDGRWMAYDSPESGELQVYVQSVPPSGGKWQVSATGGAFPQWRGDGQELYYVSLANDLVAVDVETEGGHAGCWGPAATLPPRLRPDLRATEPLRRDG